MPRPQGDRGASLDLHRVSVSRDFVRSVLFMLEDIKLLISKPDAQSLRTSSADHLPYVSAVSIDESVRLSVCASVCSCVCEYFQTRRKCFSVWTGQHCRGLDVYVRACVFALVCACLYAMADTACLPTGLNGEAGDEGPEGQKGNPGQRGERFV